MTYRKAVEDAGGSFAAWDAMTEPTARDVLAEPRTEAGRELLDWVRTTSRIEEKYRTEYIAAFRKDIIAIETEAALPPQPEAAGEAGLREAGERIAALQKGLLEALNMPDGDSSVPKDWDRFVTARQRLYRLAAPALPE